MSRAHVLFQTCLHGPFYLACHRNLAEVTWWAAALLLAAACSLALNGQSVATWLRQPLQWRVAEERLPLNQVQFPMCPEQGGDHEAPRRSEDLTEEARFPVNLSQ